MALRYGQRIKNRSRINRFLLSLPLLGAACSHTPIVQPVTQPLPSIMKPAEDPFVTRLREDYKRAKPHVASFYDEQFDMFSSTFRYPIREADGRDLSIIVLSIGSKWILIYDFLGIKRETEDITEAVREISSKIGEVKGFDFVLIGSSFDGSMHEVYLGLVPKTDPLQPLFEENGESHVESKFVLEVFGRVVIMSYSSGREI